jgi:hypothetical protein
MTVLCLALALLMFIAMVQHLRSRRHHNDPLKFSLFATLVTIVTASMMQGMIVAPLQQMMIVLVFGWSLHAFGQERFALITGKTLSWYLVKYVVLLVVFLTLTLWGVKSDLAMQDKLLVSPDGVINLSYGPRFWADGHDHCVSWHEHYQSR